MNLCRGMLLAILIFSHLDATADLLETHSSNLPVSLAPVTNPDLSGQEPLVQQQLQAQRQKLVTLLGKPAANLNELAEAYGHLAMLYLAYDINTPAEKCLENAKRLAPDEFRWRYYSAWLAQQSGLTEQAQQRYLDAKKLKPDYAPLALRLGQVLIDLNQPAKAQQYLKQSLNVPGLEAASLYAYGQIDLLLRHYPDAVTHLKAAQQLAPDAGRIHYALAQALRGSGQPEAAKTYFAKIGNSLPVAKDPYIDALKAVKTSARPAFKAAMIAIRKKDYDTAVEKFTQGLKKDPENVPARISLARSRYLSGDTEGAFNELNIALQKQPDNSLGHFLIAALFEAMGQKEAARKHYQQSIQSDGENSGALFYLANLEFSEGHYPAAIKYYQAALKQTESLLPARFYREIAKNILGESDLKTLEQLKQLRDSPIPGLPVDYAIAKLLATSTEKAVYNPKRALDIAKSLTKNRSSQSSLKLLALTLAANHQFNLAAETQRKAITFALWSRNDITEYTNALNAYLSQKLPQQKNPLNDPVLTPPDMIPAIPFQNYPAPKPF